MRCPPRSAAVSIIGFVTYGTCCIAVADVHYKPLAALACEISKINEYSTLRFNVKGCLLLRRMKEQRWGLIVSGTGLVPWVGFVMWRI